jgi:hypothetical protein
MSGIGGHNTDFGEAGAALYEAERPGPEQRTIGAAPESLSEKSSIMSQKYALILEYPYAKPDPIPTVRGLACFLSSAMEEVKYVTQ